jgi:hypothetical protein
MVDGGWISYRSRGGDVPVPTGPSVTTTTTLTVRLFQILFAGRMSPEDSKQGWEQTNGRDLPTDRDLPKKLDLGVTLKSEAEPSGPMTSHIGVVRRAGRFAQVAVESADADLSDPEASL